MKSRVAAVQMTTTENIEQNWKQATELLKEAVSLGAKLVSFPENMLLMTADRKRLRHFAQLRKPQSEWITKLSELAKNHRVFVIAGTIPTHAKQSKKILNSSLVFGPTGKILAHYDKIHLFDADVSGDRPYRESHTFQSGKKLVTCKTAAGLLGLSVCYDIRFPELYRALSRKGVEILSIPVAFTVPTGQAHWDVLTRARAIENLSYVVAPAQVGTHYLERRTYGNSRIIDPWGAIIAEAKSDQPCCLVAEIDLSHLRAIRTKMPALKHRRIFAEK